MSTGRMSMSIQNGVPWSNGCFEKSRTTSRHPINCYWTLSRTNGSQNWNPCVKISPESYRGLKGMACFFHINWFLWHIKLKTIGLLKKRVPVIQATMDAWKQCDASTITSAQVVGRTILSAPAIKFTLKMKLQWWDLVFGVFQLGCHRDLMNRQWWQLVFGVLHASRHRDLS